MLDTKKAMKSIKSSITRFDKAAQKYGVKGMYQLDEHIDIELEYKHSRKHLEELIEKHLNFDKVADTSKVESRTLSPVTIALLNESVRD